MKKCVAGLLMLSFAGMASAAPIVQEATIATSTTNFSENVMFDKFDDMGGTLTLQSVIISFDGLLDGSIGVESMDAMPTTITTTISASLTLGSDVGTLLDMSQPDIVNMFDASAFDGSIDFAGTSGTTFDDIGGAVMGSATYTDSSILDFFTGDDMVTVMFDAIAASFASGPGNLATEFRMAAGGTVRLEYESINTVVVSAPATSGVILLGGLAAFGFRRFSN